MCIPICISINVYQMEKIPQKGGGTVKNVKKIIDVISSAMLVVFVLFVVLLVGVRLVGLEPHIVLSGSMEPEILTGSLVYVTRLSPKEACELEAGDTVTYLVDAKGTKVTHKIYERVGVAHVKNQYGEFVLDENGEPAVAIDDKGYPIVMYTTYGVNNKNQSSPSGYTLDGTPGVGNLASSNIFGKPLFTIPYLGYVAHFVQNPPGRYVALAICIILICTTFLGGSSDKGEKKKGDTAAETPVTPTPDTADGAESVNKDQSTTE